MIKKFEITVEQLRTLWAERQGLLRASAAGVAEIVQTAGWMHSAGSAGPYLALRARIPGCRRRDVDREVFEAGTVADVPTLRGCIMLVPEEDLPLAFAWAQKSYEPHFKRAYQACPGCEHESKNLCEIIVRALEGETLNSGELRQRLPQHLLHDLGNSGKAVGESSTLSLALRRLQVRGIVQRVATDHHLNSSKFAYRLFPASVSQKAAAMAGGPALVKDLAARFFHWAAPATVKDFAWWAGISQKEAKTAIENLRLFEAGVQGEAQVVWLREEDCRKLDSARAQEANEVSLMPFRDNYLYLHRNMVCFVRPEDRSAQILDWKNRLTPISEADSIHNNAIVAGGRLVGLWEYDPEDSEIVWRIFSKLTASQKDRLLARIESLEAFIREELGDAPLYAVDTGRQRRQRISALRKTNRLAVKAN